MAARLTKEQFIEKAKFIHDNKFDYSLVKFINTKSKVTIICPDHGPFEITPSSHYRSGCPKCQFKKQSKRKAKTTKEFIAEARSVHGDRYDYSETNYINKRTKVDIICKTHGLFSQVPGNHLESSGCYRCSRIAVGKKRRGIKNNRHVTNTSEFKIEARKIHNNYFDYSKVIYKGTKGLLTISCPKHGDFQQTAHNHLTGFKCPKCASVSISNKFSLKQSDFIKRATEIHGDKFNYNQVNYVNARIKVQIICPFHGVFEILPFDHLSGKQCNKCSRESVTNSNEEFIAQAKLIHGDKYDYSKSLYRDNNTKITIICKIHGPFQQLPRSHATHSTASGCPECNAPSFWDPKALTEEQKLAQMAYISCF